MLKIVITGASGFIAGAVRKLYADHHVTLLSRSPMAVAGNETLVRCEELANVDWWSNVRLDGAFDRIFHFAEPVKQRLGPGDVGRIARSHIAFLGAMTKRSPQIYYPLSAYRYDDALGSAAAAYRDIKETVFDACRALEQICFPVIHPVLDAGRGIQSLKNLESKVPYLNVFAGLSSKMPVLYFRDLMKFFDANNAFRSGVVDVYSEEPPISSIFRRGDRRDVPFVSKAVEGVLRIGSHVINNANVNLLLRGRQVHDQNS